MPLVHSRSQGRAPFGHHQESPLWESMCRVIVLYSQLISQFVRLDADHVQRSDRKSVNRGLPHSRPQSSSLLRMVRKAKVLGSKMQTSGVGPFRVHSHFAIVGADQEGRCLWGLKCRWKR